MPSRDAYDRARSRFRPTVRGPAVPFHLKTIVRCPRCSTKRPIVLVDRIWSPGRSLPRARRTTRLQIQTCSVLDLRQSEQRRRLAMFYPWRLTCRSLPRGPRPLRPTVVILVVLFGAIPPPICLWRFATAILLCHFPHL